MVDFRAGRFRKTATITIPLPPDEAMGLFTARGERDWVDGWEPRFPAGEPTDEDEGTVFLTTADAQPTYWVVAAKSSSTIRYARVTPGLHAGTVEVRQRRKDARATGVEVTYDLTALTPEGAADLDDRAAHYDTEIHAWQDAIETALARRAP